jgi:hypothetical protein
MNLSPDWRISTLSLAWLLAGVFTSVALAFVVRRSPAPARHAATWAWLAFVSGSEAWAWSRLRSASRCYMSYADVTLIVGVGAGLGLACGASSFWLVRSRGWGTRRSSTLAAVSAAVLVGAFFCSVLAFWFSDPCSPRDYWP